MSAKLARMRVLALDTSTAWESVAVCVDGVVVGEVGLVATDAHSRRVLPAVEYLLRETGIGIGEIDLFAAATGPGSFTGLRVGIATVQGLALASGRPAFGVSTLDLLAALHAGGTTPLVAAIDAHHGELFTALYDAEGRLQGELQAERVEALLARAPAAARWVGDAAVTQRARIEAAVASASLPDRGLFLAGTLARLAALRAAESGPPGTLRPTYVRAVHIRTSAPRA